MTRVHWIYDAFAVDAAGQMDLTQNVGGVPSASNRQHIAANGLTQAAAADLRIT
jgi:hypothetical protein